MKFEWTPACQRSFNLLKETLCCEPILKYADTSKPYTLYTDASKYSWAGVLTQKHTTVIDGKSHTTDHPVTFVSGLFRGSQLNWAALTKEAFAICMSVKNLSFSLTDAQILLRSDHKPLEKFLHKDTLNSKVNNWAMELEAFNIEFDYIKGSHNVLADTMSRLVNIDPDTQQHPEGPGYEFGYAVIEEFPEVKTNTYEVNEVIVGTQKEIKNDPDLQDTLQCIKNPIAPERLKRLQEQDANIVSLKHKLKHNKLDQEYYSLDEHKLLMRKVVDGGHKFCAIYLSSVLVFQVLRAAHDELGPKDLCSSQKSILLERHERRHQATLQSLCYMYPTPIRKCQVRKEDLSPITATNGFHLYGFERRILPSYQSWSLLCINGSLHAYRVHMVYTTEDKDSRRSSESILGPHLQFIWRKCQNHDG